MANVDIRAAIGSAVFFVLAPGMTAGLVPFLITRWDVPDEYPTWAVVLGLLWTLAGAALVVTCFVRFVTEGRGTPAPVAPTEELVVGGVYRYVRNPMYVGVGSAIAGQVVAFGSLSLAAWLALFMLAVWSFVHWYEEPTLTSQFGESYERYRTAVPGWWPRLTPWRG